MDAKIINGREIANEIKEDLKEEILRIKESHPDFLPKLAIVQVGDREDSNVYIRMKIRLAAEVGVETHHAKFPRTITEEELVNEVDNLNKDQKIHGIIVQLPLDTIYTIDSDRIINTVSPKKDVDGICDNNAGKLSHGRLEGDYFLPCTPKGCVELINRTGISLEGSKAIVLGRSKIVGSPASQLLLWNGATVTLCHRKSQDVPSLVRESDIVLVAVGQPELVRASWIKPGAVVIDCGINQIPDPTKKSGHRIVGDVAFDEVKKVASHITPVPGGVGPMTVVMLIQNTVSAAKNFKFGEPKPRKRSSVSGGPAK